MFIKILEIFVLFKLVKNINAKNLDIEQTMHVHQGALKIDKTITMMEITRVHF
jgi:hypothetical protein